VDHAAVVQSNEEDGSLLLFNQQRNCSRVDLQPHESQPNPKWRGEHRQNPGAAVAEVRIACVVVQVAGSACRAPSGPWGQWNCVAQHYRCQPRGKGLSLECVFRSAHNRLPIRQCDQWLCQTDLGVKVHESECTRILRRYQHLQKIYFCDWTHKAESAEPGRASQCFVGVLHE